MAHFLLGLSLVSAAPCFIVPPRSTESYPFRPLSFFHSFIRVRRAVFILIFNILLSPSCRAFLFLVSQHAAYLVPFPLSHTFTTQFPYSLWSLVSSIFPPFSLPSAKLIFQGNNINVPLPPGQLAPYRLVLGWFQGWLSCSPQPPDANR